MVIYISLYSIYQDHQIPLVVFANPSDLWRILLDKERNVMCIRLESDLSVWVIEERARNVESLRLMTENRDVVQGRLNQAVEVIDPELKQLSVST